LKVAAAAYNCNSLTIDLGRAKLMSAVKEQAMQVIQSLPDDCTMDDIQYHLYVRSKIERGLAAMLENRVVSQDEAERRIRQWAESSDPNPH
jgi:hypothetical protein